MKLYQVKNTITKEIVFEVLSSDISSAYKKAKKECLVEFEEIEEHPNENHQSVSKEESVAPSKSSQLSRRITSPSQDADDIKLKKTCSSE